MCGLAARGLWMECLTIMHEATPYGHLIVNGHVVTDTQLALLSGARQDEIGALLTELETAGVFSRNRNGVIYSRRMTRDEKRAKSGAKSASKRWSQDADSKQEKHQANGLGNGVSTPEPITHMPEARNQREAKASKSVVLGFEEFYKAYPRKKAPDRARRAYALALKNGATPEKLLSGARRYADECAGKEPQFVKHPATWLNDGDWREAPQGPSTADEAEAAERIKARTRLRNYKPKSFWPYDWGPRPDEPGCKLPPDIMREFGYEPIPEEPVDNVRQMQVRNMVSRLTA